MARKFFRSTPVEDTQLDLFAPVITDVGPRDARDVMELPFLSLSKQKRTKPIEYTNARTGATIHIGADPKYGIANIYDWDLMIFVVSVIRSALDRGEKVSPRIRFAPGDYLRATRKPNTAHYQQGIMSSIRRLHATNVETNIRMEDQSSTLERERGFHWIADYEILTRTIRTASGGTKKIVEYYEVRLCNWLYNAVKEPNLVLTFDPDYFLLDGGYERWLYRLIRKSAGKGTWDWSLRQLYDRSGQGESYKKFVYRIRDIVRRNETERLVPGYILEIETQAGKRGYLLRAKAIETKDVRAPLLPGEDTHRLRAGSFAIDYETEDEARKLCQAYDLDYHALYEAWKASNLKRRRSAKPGEEAKLRDPGKAFLGYIRACGRKVQKADPEST